MLERQVTAPLFVLSKTRTFERAYEPHRIHLRQPGQTSLGARTVTGIANPFLVRFSKGIGSPCCSKVSGEGATPL